MQDEKLKLDNYKAFISHAMRCIPEKLTNQERLSVAARLFRIFKGNTNDMDAVMIPRPRKSPRRTPMNRKDAFKISKQQGTLRFSYEHES